MRETLEAELAADGTQLLARRRADLEEQLHRYFFQGFGVHGEILNQDLQTDPLDTDHFSHQQQGGSCFCRTVLVNHVVILLEEVEEIQAEVILLFGQTL